MTASGKDTRLRFALFLSIGCSVSSLLFAASTSSSLAPQTATVPARSFIGADGNPLPFENDEEVMEFLRKAKVTKRSDIGTGINRFKKCMLEKDGVRANAIFRDVDVTERNSRVGDRQYFIFRDSYLFECAAYHLCRLLGINNIPPVVLRSFGRTKGSLQLWIEDVRDEDDEDFAPPSPLAWARQFQEMRLFDNLIFNVDRSAGNILVTQDYTLIMIDQTRGFQQFNTLLTPDSLKNVRRETWEKLNSVSEEEFRGTVRKYLTSSELSSLVARWKLLIQHFEELIAHRGEELVVY